MVRAAAAGVAAVAAAVSDSLLDDSASEEAVDTGLAGSCGCCGRREGLSWGAWGRGRGKGRGRRK